MPIPLDFTWFCQQSLDGGFVVLSVRTRHLVLNKILCCSLPRFVNNKSAGIILVLQEKIVNETGFSAHRIQKGVQQRSECSFFTRLDLEMHKETKLLASV